MKASTIKLELDSGTFTRSQRNLSLDDRKAKLTWLENYAALFPSKELAEFKAKHKALSTTMSHTTTQADRVIKEVAAQLQPIYDAVVMGKIPDRGANQSDQERLNFLRTTKRGIDNEIGGDPCCPGREQRQRPRCRRS